MMLLYTKDGRKWTNAILIGEANPFREGRISDAYRPEYAVHTDFGNVRYLTIEEIQRDYYLGEPRDYGAWLEDRNSHSTPALNTTRKAK